MEFELKATEKEEIIKKLRKHLKKLICSLKATKNYFLKTQLKQLQKEIAYNLKAKNLNTDYQNFTDEGLTLEKYVSTANLLNAYANCDESSFLTKMIPGSVVVSSISALDYYISQLLHTLLDYDRKLADIVEIKLPYKDIGFLEDCKDIREYCLSTYLESLFFGSHDELFETISKKFNVRSIKKIHSYKDFLFVTELRNIIVHNDSTLNPKFKVNMEKYKINFEEYGFFDEDGGMVLNLENTMWVVDVCISVALQMYLEVCEHYCKKNQKLTEFYAGVINSICVDLISEGYPDVCYVIYDGLLQREKHSSDRYLFSINKALCLKEMEKQEEMQAFLGSISWEECPEEYLFAKYILLEDYETAVEYMDKVSLTNWDCGYQDWPLCESFVETDLFKSRYESIYGREYEKKVTRGRLSEKEVLKILEEYEKSKNGEK